MTQTSCATVEQQSRIDPLVPSVSFIIPVRSNADALRRCLHTVLSNQYPSDRLEIIVVDNGSVDDSAVIAQRAGAIVLHCPGLAVSALRNKGASVASGDVLAFVDADHEIDPNWVASAVESLALTPNVGAVGAQYEAPPDATWVQRSYDLFRHRPDGLHDTHWLGAGNMVVGRHTFEAIGGFDATLESCEDVDLCRRIRHSGRRVLQDSRLRSIHLGDPATLTELFRGELWRGRDNLRVSLRGEVTLHELPSVVVPVVNLALLAVALAAAVTMTTAGTWVAAAALAALVCGALARATRMMSQVRRKTALGWAQAIAVATTYDLARALALVRGASHETRSRK